MLFFKSFFWFSQVLDYRLLQPFTLSIYDLSANRFASILLCSPIILVQKANSCLAKSATICHLPCLAAGPVCSKTWRYISLVSNMYAHLQCRHVYIYIYVCIYIYMYMYVYVWLRLHMYTYIYIYIQICVCVYLHIIYIYMYVYVRISLPLSPAPSARELIMCLNYAITKT